MANEFIIKNGFQSKGNSQITGSLDVSGSSHLGTSATISGSLTLKSQTDNNYLYISAPSAGNVVTINSDFIGAVMTFGPGNYINTQGQAIHSLSRGAIFQSTITNVSPLKVGPSGNGLEVDWSTHYVGIHKSTPTAELDVNGDVIITGSLDVSGSSTLLGNSTITGSLTVGETSIYKSGSTVLNVEGSSGQLFSITDTLSGSLYSVNDISGLPIFEVFSDDTIIAGAYNQNDFVITDSKIGIGTASPSVKLNVEYDDNAFSAGLVLKNINTGSSATAGIGIQSANFSNPFSIVQESTEGNAIIYNGEDADMMFYTNAIEKVRITNIGNVGIGKNSPTSKLDISGSLTVTGSIKTEVVALSVASNTASMDCTLSNSFTLDLVAGTDTYLNPTNIQPGQSLNLKITQDAVEAGTLSYGSDIKFSNTLPYNASSTLEAIDIVSFASFDSTTLYASALKDFN